MLAALQNLVLRSPLQRLFALLPLTAHPFPSGCMSCTQFLVLRTTFGLFFRCFDIPPLFPSILPTTPHVLIPTLLFFFPPSPSLSLRNPRKSWYFSEFPGSYSLHLNRLCKVGFLFDAYGKSIQMSRKPNRSSTQKSSSKPSYRCISRPPLHPDLEGVRRVLLAQQIKALQKHNAELEESSGMKSRWYEVKGRLKKKFRGKQRKKRNDTGKRQQQPKPCPCKILKQGQFVRAASVSSALRRLIQAVIFQQSKDKPNQFSGS